MNRIKRSVVLWGMLAVTLWPAVQIGLVKRYDVNPWKLAGWGMYAVPRLQGDVRILAQTPDEVGTYELSTIPEELDRPLLDFLYRRRGLGFLARPDDLAQALLDHYTAIDGVTILYVKPEVDAHTGMIVQQTTTYDYPR